MDKKAVDKLTSVLIAMVAFVLYLMTWIQTNATVVNNVMQLIPTTWGIVGLIIGAIIIIGLGYWNYKTPESREEQAIMKYLEQRNIPYKK